MRTAANTSSPGERRIDWLDALRGWAITGVLLVHSSIDVPDVGEPWHSIANAGQYGVQLFFVVSALTVFHTYRREVERGASVAHASLAWLTKRFFRIAPLYYYGIVLYLIIYAIMRSRGSLIPEVSAGDVLANMLFIHTWVPSAQNTVVPGGWSIGVEMIFYLTVPLLFWRVRSAFFCLLLFIACAGIAEAADRAMSIHLSGGPHIENNSFLYLWLVTQFPVFVAGLGLLRFSAAHIWSSESIPVRRVLIFATFGLAMAAVGLALGTTGGIDHALAPSFMGLAFCGLVMCARGAPFGPILVNRFSAWVGRLSYSVYINHFAFVLLLRLIAKLTGLRDTLPGPVLLFGTFVIAFALALAAASATYRMIEQPGIELGRRLAAAIERRAPAQPARYSAE